MVTVPVYLYVLLLHFVNLDFVISDDDFYKKFHQTDYKINFERGALTYFNKSYGEAYQSTFKYNRTHFGSNTTLLLKVDMDYDLEIVVQAYKYLSNEYRDFPMRFQFNFCKGFKNNFAGFKDCAEKCGYVGCPLKKNVPYSVCNCLMDESKLPPLIPTGRFELALEGLYKKDTVFKSETYIDIYRPIPSGRRFG